MITFHFYKELQSAEVDALKANMVAEIMHHACLELKISRPTILWFQESDYPDADFVRNTPIRGAARPDGSIMLCASQSLEDLAETVLHELYHLQQFKRGEAKRMDTEDKALAFGRSPACREIMERFRRLDYQIQNTRIAMR
jgi:hypothetical protein